MRVTLIDKLRVEIEASARIAADMAKLVEGRIEASPTRGFEAKLAELRKLTAEAKTLRKYATRLASAARAREVKLCFPHQHQIVSKSPWARAGVTMVTVRCRRCMLHKDVNEMALTPIKLEGGADSAALFSE